MMSDALPEKMHDYPVPPSPMGEVVDPSWEVEPEDVKTKLESNPEAFVLLDCRRPHELEIARIEGSVHFQMEEMPGRAEELRRFCDEEVIVYCHHGRRSLRVASFLRACGVANVKSMAGGIDRWSQEIDMDVPVY